MVCLTSVNLYFKHLCLMKLRKLNIVTKLYSRFLDANLGDKLGDKFGDLGDKFGNHFGDLAAKFVTLEVSAASQRAALPISRLISRVSWNLISKEAGELTRNL
ncbi:hypothetical protein AVEN_160269-1 [Araneus ventricosus]|uniref:Uncharacterized protein n=1 Tax=Araneus ventricosus TaxID=182803 RepID=A0A4Y2P3L4_ARAVE|nr:hypothetical protein AVEN_160269-1 [Araneus ventricosus]